VKIVIVGCGRVGSVVAEAYDAAGHDVVIVDSQTSAFDRLPDTFHGRAVRGDGTDEDVLRRAGAEGADVFIALTEGDNRNVMAAQLAAEALGIDKVIAKLNDPVRAAAYADLGIATLCRTGLMLDSINGYLGIPASGLPGMQAPTGHHPGPHHDTPADLPGGASAETPDASAEGSAVTTSSTVEA
jgi:trk system potassium uptake protein TrkA